MLNLEGLEENFQFLVVEVQSQLQRTFRFLSAPDNTLYRNIINKDDYIDNLKTVIENKCFSRIHKDETLSKKQINTIRAIHIMCVNLERIADFCVNIVVQMDYLSSPDFVGNADYLDIFLESQQSLARILPVLHTGDMAGAVSICRSEHQIDMLYEKNFRRIMENICSGENPQDHITLIFILRYLERIGDSLLNIGEALIFSILGEKIKIDQFDSLRKAITKEGFAQGISDVEFRSIWGTRSGCRIGRVRTVTERASQEADGRLFKEGSKGKIAREKSNLKLWDEILPGLVPKVYNYAEEGNKASLLIGFLPGSNFDEVILGADATVLEEAGDKLVAVMEKVYTSTMERQSFRGNYMEQLEDRLDGILGMHPGFFRYQGTMGEVQISSTKELVARCKKIQEQFPAPFKVFTHGDLNTNNIVYNPTEKQIHFIDVYRSGPGDFVQDASVFLVSSFRMPVFESALRERINRTIEKFYLFFEQYAKKQNDETFPVRMALGLGRSFLTSTRFELNARFAKDMFLRSHFLMEKLANHREGVFVLPTDVLYY